MSETSVDLPQTPSGWVSLPDVAERMDVPITKVHQMLKDGTLLAVRRDGVRYVPAELVAGRNVFKHLPGVLTLLKDAGTTTRKPSGGSTRRTTRCRERRPRCSPPTERPR